MGKPGTKTLQLQTEAEQVGPDGHAPSQGTATTGPLTSRSPCPPPPSLVEVLLGSELLLSVFQKDRECVICCCLSCRETKEEAQGLPLPRPAPAHFGDQNSASVLKVSAVGRWDMANDGEGLPWGREGVSSLRNSDEGAKGLWTTLPCPCSTFPGGSAAGKSLF